MKAAGQLEVEEIVNLDADDDEVNTQHRYYYEAKMGESKSHGKKGTWDVVPLPEWVKPVTSHGATTDKYGPDG
ncbi:hypothetical protein AFLA70_140g002201 [Aspergillus flavus AF70]|nr:hypothetical protein AFLA70_140g002201 [Aspergillus flavus AF70]